MSLIVSSIVEGFNEQTSIVKKGCADDWTVERAIIASNWLWKLNNFILILWKVLKPIGKMSFDIFLQYSSKENKCTHTLFSSCGMLRTRLSHVHIVNIFCNDIM